MKQRSKFNIKVLLALIAISLIGIASYYFFSNKSLNPTQQNLSASTNSESQKMAVDLDGDGSKEYVVIDPVSDNPNQKSLSVFNEENEIIAYLPEEMNIMDPMDDSFKTYILDSNKKTEVFSFDFIAGPHQTETMFFELVNDRLSPICHSSEVRRVTDCLFYSGNTGQLVVLDIDNDSFSEIVEEVDEYPKNGVLTQEEKDAIAKVSKEEGNEDFATGATRIAEREKGGRGRKVVWKIYSYNGQHFDPILDESSEKLYSLFTKGNQNYIRKSELTDSSLDYLEFVRKFWTP